jgi:hypothetical protein
MWKWIQAFILSIIIICVGHFLWQFFRDNLTKPIVKPFIFKNDIQKEENEIIENVENIENIENVENVENVENIENIENVAVVDNVAVATYDELDNYLKSKINILNTTDINSLSTHYDSPSS